MAVQGDVSKAADVQRLFAETKKTFGKLDVLVNNAAIYEFAPLGDINEDHFHRQFNINVLGLILTTQEAAKHFGPEGGSVINISSAVTDVTPPNTSVYTATKGAVDAVTRVLAKELGPNKVRVTRSILDWCRRKATRRPACQGATWRSRPRRRLRWDESDSQGISHRSRCS